MQHFKNDYFFFKLLKKKNIIITFFFIFLSTSCSRDWMMDISKELKSDKSTHYVLTEDMLLKNNSHDRHMVTSIIETFASDFNVEFGSDFNINDSFVLSVNDLIDSERVKELHIIPKGSIVSMKKLYLISTAFSGGRQIYYIFAQIQVQGVNEIVWLRIDDKFTKIGRGKRVHPARFHEFQEIASWCLINKKTGASFRIELPKSIWENKSMRKIE